MWRRTSFLLCSVAGGSAGASSGSTTTVPTQNLHQAAAEAVKRQQKNPTTPYSQALRVATMLTTAGVPIYHEKGRAFGSLQSIKASPQHFWEERCDAFLEEVKNVETFKKSFITKSTDLNLVIAMEGLDGVGKTTVTKALAEKLGAKIIKTPNLKYEDNLRAWMRNLPAPLARAFYCSANYLAAVEIIEVAKSSPVIVDRWFGSTCSMAVANLDKNSDDIPQDPAIYQWPSDLPTFDKGYLLTVDEEIRMARINRRGDGPNSEEKELAESSKLRGRIVQAYSKMRPRYEEIDCPTYMDATNSILKSLEAGDELVQAKLARIDVSLRQPFTAEQIASVPSVGLNEGGEKKKKEEE